jgi:hypothetical protein
MMRTPTCVAIAIACVLLAGCGGDVEREHPKAPTGPPNPSVSLATESVEVTEVDYHGWKALRMANGLVVLVAVPDIGGRIMEYKLNAHPFLWTNPEEYGHLYESPRTESERAWHNYGGYKIWPAPQSEWGGPGDPVGSQLDAGKWTGEIVERAGQVGEIKLTSPPDPSVTGLQITRRVRLFAGGTRVEISETYSNVSDHDIRWSVWDVTQVPGSLSADSPASDQSCIYFPLNPDSEFDTGFVELIDNPDARSQWEVLQDHGLMRVSYRQQTGKIGADSLAGWIAHVDEMHNMAYVKRFEVSKLAEYPDQGSIVEVYTSGKESYMEVEVLSPLIDLKPGDEHTVVREWFAAAVPGPILTTGQAGALAEPLECTEGDEGKLKVTGVFGVFAEGSAILATADADGRMAEPLLTFPASPAVPLAIEEQVERPDDAPMLVLELQNANGTPVGRLASVEIPQAEAPQVASAAGGNG